MCRSCRATTSRSIVATASPRSGSAATAVASANSCDSFETHGALRARSGGAMHSLSSLNLGDDRQDHWPQTTLLVHEGADALLDKVADEPVFNFATP